MGCSPTCARLCKHHGGNLLIGLLRNDLSQVDFRKLSRSGRPKYSQGGHAALNAAVSSGVSPFSTSAAAAHSILPSTSNGTPTQQQKDKEHQQLPQLPQIPQSQPSTSTAGSSSGSFRNNYYTRPGLRRCTQVQDTLKLEVGVCVNSAEYSISDKSAE